MEGFIQKGSIYRHESGAYRLRERKGRAFEVEYAERPGLWISTGAKDIEKAAESVRKSMHSARRYVPNEKVTVAEFGDGFFTDTGEGSYQARCALFGKRYEPKYYTYQNGRYTNYIRPRFGKLDIRDVTTRTIEEWYIGLTSYRHPGEKLNDGTKTAILDAFSEIMKAAVRKGIIEENPCDGVQRITIHRGDSVREIFEKEELALLFPNDRALLLQTWGDLMWALYFSIMLDTGFRPCEVAGLTRDSFDDNGGVYTRSGVDASTRVRKERIKTTGRGKGTKYGLLSHYTMDILEDYLKELDGEYLFLSYDGKFIYPELENRILRRACWVVGIDIRERTQYCLRHTFDTHMMNSLGENVKESDVLDLMAHTGYRPEYDHRTPQQILFKLQKVRPAIESMRENAQ